MSGHQNARLLHGAMLVGSGRTESKLFVMRDSGFPIVSHATAEDPEDARGAVIGEVYRVPDQAMLARLDSLEGHPTWYRRENITVALDTAEGEPSILVAEMYIMPREMADGREFIKDLDYATHESKRRKYHAAYQPMTDDEIEDADEGYAYFSDAATQDAEDDLRWRNEVGLPDDD